MRLRSNTDTEGDVVPQSAVCTTYDIMITTSSLPSDLWTTGQAAYVHLYLSPSRINIILGSKVLEWLQENSVAIVTNQVLSDHQMVVVLLFSFTNLCVC